MSVAVGAGLSDSFSAVLDGDKLTYTYRSWSGDEERASVTPDAAAWRSFRSSVERLKGWPWRGRFEQPPEGFATDGIDWAITLSYADGSSAVCEGYNAFPPDGEGIDPPRSFRNFCRAVSRLLGGRYFGWEQAPQPAETAAKGSQLRIRQWVGEHRERFERELFEASPSLAAWGDGPIDWLSPRSASEFKELRDDLWPLVGVDPSPQESGWWPKRGPVWDAVGVLPGQAGPGIVLVEAKSHESELRSPRSKASPASLRVIEAALEETRDALGVEGPAAWAETYYQVANRLAFLYWLHHHAGRTAWLVNVYFLGDRFASGSTEVVGPHDEVGWASAIADAKDALRLPSDHRLSPWSVDLFLPAEPEDSAGAATEP